MHIIQEFNQKVNQKTLDFKKLFKINDLISL